MSSQYDLLSHRMHTLLSDTSLSPSPLKPIFDTIWSSISFHNNKIQMLQEQISLMSTTTQIHSKLSDKVSLDEMMGCLGSVNEVLKKKVEHKEVIDIVEKCWKNRGRVESDINEIKGEIERIMKISEEKYKEMQANSKWQNQYFSKKIKNLKSQIIQTTSLPSHSTSNNHLKTYATESSQSLSDPPPTEPFQKLIMLSEKQELKLNTLYKRQNQSQQNLNNLAIQTQKIFEKIQLSLQENLELQNQSQKSITSSSILLVELSNKVMKLQSSYQQIQSIAETLCQGFSGVDNERYVTLNDFSKFQADMNIVYKSIIGDCIVGRWGYRNIDTQNNSKTISPLKWQYQMINTLSDNYNWCSNSKDILINYKGIYEIILYTFSKVYPGNKRYILRVNGKAMVQNKLEKEEGKRKEGATRLSQVLCLGKGSRISIETEGSVDHAILSIKKL